MTPHPAGAQREALRLAYAALTAPETSIGGWYAHSVTGVLPVIREALAAADGSVPEDGGEAGCPNYPATCRGCVECRAEIEHDGPCFCDCPPPEHPGFCYWKGCGPPVYNWPEHQAMHASQARQAVRSDG